jgi:hypothetical protein
VVLALPCPVSSRTTDVDAGRRRWSAGSLWDSVRFLAQAARLVGLSTLKGEDVKVAKAGEATG